MEQRNQREVSVEAWIGLGSNLGDRRANLDGALRSLSLVAGIRVLRVSDWLETLPIGGPAGQGLFLNGVASLETELGAHELLANLQAVETRFGRERAVVNGPRTLDLDLLVFGDERIERAGLKVPHPRMEDRTFVLEPLAQLAPEMRLPVCGLTVRTRLAALERAAAAEGSLACP